MIDHGTLQGLGWDISFQVDAVKNEALMVCYQQMRPFMLLRPRMFPDGDQWCALYGDDLQEGVAGFGHTPADAANDFDVQWLNQKCQRKP